MICFVFSCSRSCFPTFVSRFFIGSVLSQCLMQEAPLFTTRLCLLFVFVSFFPVVFFFFLNITWSTKFIMGKK